jgi:hypothetical protein
MLSASVWAQSGGDPERVPIYFRCQCNDTVGGNIETAFRDRHATSPRYEERDDPQWQGLHLKLISIDPSREDDGTRTIYTGILLRGNDYYVTSEVQICGADRVQDCVSSLMALLDNGVHP